MSRWTRVSIWAAVFIIGVGVGIFLITQGLSQAALWATILGLPIAVLGSVAGAWSAVLAARTLKEARAASPDGQKTLKEAHVELVDASPDPGIQASFGSFESHTEAAPEQPHAIADIEPGDSGSASYSAIDFKFINRGDATAVLHRFGLEILSFHPDLTPLLRHSYHLTRDEVRRNHSTSDNMSDRAGSMREDMGWYSGQNSFAVLGLTVRNEGWGEPRNMRSA